MTNKSVCLVRLAFSSVLARECKFCIMFGFGGSCSWCTLYNALWILYNALCTWCTLYKTLMHLCANWHLCERRWASSRNVIMNTTARIRIIMNTARIWVHVNTSGTNSYQASGYILYACEHINQVCTVRINQILIKPQFYGQDMSVSCASLPLKYHTHTPTQRIPN